MRGTSITNCCISSVLIIAAASASSNAHALPDLMITFASASTSGSSGQVIDVSATVRNKGDMSAPEADVRFYLSSDNALSVFDTLTTYGCTTTTLAPGQEFTCAGKIRLPILMSGSYYIGAIVDGANLIAESDESNNGLLASFATAITGTPVLTATLGTPAPGSAVSGVAVISGFHCTSKDIDIFIDGAFVSKAGAGTTIGTQSNCGRTDTGFSYLYNFNNLSNGLHTAVAFADGIVIGSTTFYSFQSGGTPWLAGASKSATVADFPTRGQSATIVWSQAYQNFFVSTISGVSNSSSFALKSAYTRLVKTGYSGDFTVSGSCTGSGSMTVTPAVQDSSISLPKRSFYSNGYSTLTTITRSLAGCPQEPAVSIAYGYYDLNYLPIGNGSQTFASVFLAPSTIPDSVTSGDTGPIGTVDVYDGVYSNPRKLGTIVMSYKIEPESASSVVVDLISKTYAASDNQLAVTIDERFRLSSDGVLRPIRTDIQAVNPLLPDLRYTFR